MMKQLVRTTPYEWTVRSASKHSTSIKDIAEGLARDIPRRTCSDMLNTDLTVIERLIEAQGLMVATGSKKRSINTLKEYRHTGLWAYDIDNDTFGWIPGASFTLHDEARLLGWNVAKLRREWAKGGLTVAVLRRLRGRQVHGFR